jgi:hypothetical protein
MQIKQLIEMLNNLLKEKIISNEDKIFVTDINDKVLIEVNTITMPKVKISLKKSEKVNNGSLLIGNYIEEDNG